MKSVMGYSTLYKVCEEIVDKMQMRNFKPDGIIAVARGGFTSAHIIGKMLNLKIGVYFPGQYQLVFPYVNLSDHSLLFCEDLIAQGRTFNEIEDFMEPTWPNVQWMFAPTLIDAGYKVESSKIIRTMTASEWIVFPYEADSCVVEGDRGLFREGTDQYGH